MITPYTSQQPIDDFGLRFSDLLYSVSLAATTDTTLTIPGIAHYYKALIKVPYNAVVWVALNATAAVPAGDTLAATTSELVGITPLCREVKKGDVLHFISATLNTEISVVLYAVGTNN
jgi:hypothetical protein